MSKPPSLRALIGVATLTVLAAAFVAPAAAASCGESNDNWTSIPVGSFGAGDKTISGFAIEPRSPRTMYVTNGTVVLRTRDAGCSFKKVYSLDDAASLGATARIKSISTSEDTTGLVYLLIQEGVDNEALGDSNRPRVVVSSDFGSNWAAADVGLPPNGRPEFLLPAPSDRSTAYLGIDLGGGSTDLLFATTNAGGTWTLRSDITAHKPAAGIMGMTVDPANAAELWAWGTGTPANESGQSSGREASGLMRSTDGGRTFQNVPEFANDVVGPVDVFHVEGAPPRIAAFRPLKSDLMWSVGGEDWTSVPTPYQVDSATHMDAANTGALTAGGQAYGYIESTVSWINLGARQGVRGITADRVDFKLYAYTDRTIEVYSGPIVPPIPVAGPDSIGEVSLIQTPDSPKPGDERLSPQRKTVRIDLGETKKVRYRLDVPQQRLPLNVFFLLDTSDSMGATIDDLANSTAEIINQLGADTVIDLKVGIGAYRAFPDQRTPLPACKEDSTVQLQCEKNYIYRLVHDISAPTPQMSLELAELESDAGGTYKSHLDALYQIATGSGVDDNPPGPNDTDVPPGRDAEFDEKALKVVVHATDERFGRPDVRSNVWTGNGRPTPPDMATFDEVAAAYDRLGERNDILHIGLSIGRQPFADLKRVSGDTNTVAPVGGVDCNGDGTAEIPEGNPLVCHVRRNNVSQSTNLVPAIVNTLKAIPHTTDVDLKVKGNDDVIAKVTPEVHEGVALQIANQLTYDVTYRCPTKLAGKELSIDLAAVDAEKNLDATARTTVVCADAPQAPVLPPLAPLVGIVAVGIPPPPPPVNVTSASQAQGQAQAQAGTVFEEEKQPQVAVAAAYKEMLEQRAAMEYEMVAYEQRREPVSPLFVLGAGFVMMGCAYGFVMARERVTLSYQRR